MFAGLTVANALGVPFGAMVGKHWGWLAAFYWVMSHGAHDQGDYISSQMQRRWRPAARSAQIILKTLPAVVPSVG